MNLSFSGQNYNMSIHGNALPSYSLDEANEIATFVLKQAIDFKPS
jgi:hypothetical protein